MILIATYHCFLGLSRSFSGRWRPLRLNGHSKHSKIGASDYESTYTYYPEGTIKTYHPGFPAGYGELSYTYNNLGQKTGMTVPLANGHDARKITYNYDVVGRQAGMTVDTVSDASSRTHSDVTGDNQTHFTYDDNSNRVQLTTRTGRVYYFVYDPKASFPAVVYELWP